MLSSFRWGALRAILSRPAPRVARSILPTIEQALKTRVAPFAGLPQTESTLVAFLEALTASEDWYAGKPPREARMVDGFIECLFDSELARGPLRWESVNNGITTQITEMAIGRFAINEGQTSERSTDLCVVPVLPPPVDDADELGSLGCRPFRCPSWDRRAAERRAFRGDTQGDGPDAAYTPTYSLSSMDDLKRLDDELKRLDTRVREPLMRLRSARLRAGCLAALDEELIGPIRRTIRARRGLYTTWNY